MSKRRRTSSIASSRGQEDDSLDSIEASTSMGPTMRKRCKKLDPMELCHQLYDSIRSHKKDDGTLLCDSFIRVPKRRQEPGYYDVVSNPIDLLKVQQKLKTEEYEDMEDLQSDIELIVNNTKAFYKKNSQEHKDACELWDLFQTNKNKILNVKDEEPVEKSKGYLKVGRPPKKAGTPVESKDLLLDHSEDTSESSTNPDEDFSLYEDLFTAVMQATDGENKPMHPSFQLLPSKRKYPEYYEVIDQPIDLRMIATKIQNNDYGSLAEVEKDLLLMTRNACLFNEPGSQIYRNAKALKKIIQTKKIELDHQKLNTSKSSERIRNKRMRGGNCLSAVTAALRDEESDVEMEPEEPDDEHSSNADPVDAENPQWQLYEAVKAVTNNNGISLSEPFWRLPSRKAYPDYYKEIKNPVSMAQIRRKLMNRSYGTVSEVAGDMTIMFENAKKYNQPTSRLYKDAVRLQKVMQTKVQELLDIDQDTDSEADDSIKRKPGQRAKNPHHVTATPVRGRPARDAIPLKKRLHSLAKYMLDFVCEDGRKPMLGFMEKPSKKLYSEYYEVISEPIDFLEIEAKIKGDQYSCENDLVKDFKLMFSNCRQFNEENSPIYEDANMLEKHLMDRVGQIITPEKKERTVVRVPRPKKQWTPTEKNLKTLYETIRDFREPKANRQLALIFMKLPSKVDYPDYYEVIKNPIDMEKISQKLKSNTYETLDEMVSDFVLMFDNACKYNEPDSQLYKDALVLQRVCLQTKNQLKEDDDTVPDVPAAIQDILLNLFTTVYNHQDADERCYTDSLADLPEHDEVDGKKVRALSLDLIKRRLDRGLYKRLDTFQDDFFSCMDRARRLSRSDSQCFEDSIELQSYFITKRDELCKNGELLHSPALNYSLMELTSQVESLRQNKQLEESLEEEEAETRSSEDSVKESKFMSVGESMTTCNQQTFKVGEFVYLDAKEKGCEPHILLIERLWTKDGQQMLYGNYYLRPAETFHLTTRKFLEKEVFKSDTHIAVPLEEVKERCCVLSIKQYFTMKPEGYDESDIYVCESRYSTRGRSFKRIKVYPENPTVKLVNREVPLEPKRVVSIFRERIEKHKDELAELQEQERIVDKEKPNVVAYSLTEIDDGNTYYEQYNTICSGIIKTGDFVYVAAEGGRQMIAQIDAIWDTKDGKCYFRGPWFVTPAEIPHTPNKMFYKQELFLSSMEDTNPVVGIMGKCAVLEFNEYISCRPTEIPESDVFICISMYDEINRQVRKLPAEGIKKYTHSGLVTDDETYYFPKLINPPKVGPPPIVQPEQVIKSRNTPVLMEVPSKCETDPNQQQQQQHSTAPHMTRSKTKVEATPTPPPTPTPAFVVSTPPPASTPPDHDDMICDFDDDSQASSQATSEGGGRKSSKERTRWTYEMNSFLYRTYLYITELETVKVPYSVELHRAFVKRFPEHSNKSIQNILDQRRQVVFNERFTPEQMAEMRHQVKIDLGWIEPDQQEASPHQLTKMTDMDMLMEDSLDGGPPSVGSGDIPVVVSTPGNSNSTSNTPVTTKKKSSKKAVVTGYILYSREVRKSVVQNNPDSNFGEISRIVGNEWRSLPTHEKQVWEEKASKLNEEAKAALLLEDPSLANSPAPSTSGGGGTPASKEPPGPPDPDRDTVLHRFQQALKTKLGIQTSIKTKLGIQTSKVFECLWDNCDFQFEDVQDCVEHCLKDSKDSQGHIQSYYAANPSPEINCFWKNCGRNNRKNLQPFPNMTRLLRHVKDMHINKGNGRSIPPAERSKNFKPSSKPPAVSRPTPTATSHPNPANSTFNSTAGTYPTTTNNSAKSTASAAHAVVQKQEPIFITVPPRPQRVLHSEAYIKYIEGLQADNKYISPWERTLHATEDNTPPPPPDSEKLQNVSAWLGKKADQHDNVVSALWQLRNKLLKDTLGLHKLL